jgi:ribonucleotide monophosphatase NagD (HAD superfamily)
MSRVGSATWRAWFTNKSSSVWPFSDIDNSGRTRDKVIHELGIKAIIVFHDPRDWGRDIQLMLDVLLPASAEDKPVKLIFCNPDMWWKADYPIPRLGQGAFKEAFSGVYTVSLGLG